ncbi:MAG: hypothetical protein SGI73_20795 [Chloroflexota bacterium]|nr:hypothetical protein [Chloroflexota bacterium]
MTNYFTAEDFGALLSPASQVVQEKALTLHATLRRRMRESNWDLHPNWVQPKGLAFRSAARIGDTGMLATALALDYLRSKDQAALVERLMGRDMPGSAVTCDIRRHPLIELRLTPTHLAVELVLSPSAWWDQRNLIGKLSIPRHQDALRTLIQRMDSDMRFGFWNGIDLSDMHLTSRQLLRGTMLHDWMNTFGDGHDWLRIGVWYAPDDAALREENIVGELVRRIGSLYTMYTFALWTSNNNFQSFYRAASTETPTRGLRA